MLTALAVLTFSGSFAIALYAIVSTTLPRLDRIRDALAGRPLSFDYMETTHG